MSSSLQRLKNRLTGNVLGASNATNTTTGPDLSRGANSNTDTSHLNLDKDPFDYAVHQYPEDLGNNDFGHYILFHIYERHNSSYVGPMKSYAAGGRSNPSSGSGGPPGRDYGGTQGEKALEGLVYSSKTAHSKNIIPEDEDTFILRAEGEELSKEIRASADRQQTVIIAEAERTSSILRGEGDAQKNKILGDAYSLDEEFFDFLRTMQACKDTFGDTEMSMVIAPGEVCEKFFGEIDIQN